MSKSGSPGKKPATTKQARKEKTRKLHAVFFPRAWTSHLIFVSFILTNLLLYLYLCQSERACKYILLPESLTCVSVNAQVSKSRILNHLLVSMNLL